MTCFFFFKVLVLLLVGPFGTLADSSSSSSSSSHKQDRNADEDLFAQTAESTRVYHESTIHGDLKVLDDDQKSIRQDSQRHRSNLVGLGDWIDYAVTDDIIATTSIPLPTLGRASIGTTHDNMEYITLSSKKMVGMKVKNLDYLSLDYIRGKNGMIEVEMALFDRRKADRLQLRNLNPPGILEDCVVEYEVHTSPYGWRKWTITPDTPFAAMWDPSRGNNCPTNSRTLRDFGHEWVFYSSELFDYPYNLSIGMRDAFVDNVGVSVRGKATFYDFETI